MTREDIMKMEAGRELDALIANLVMGYNHDYQNCLWCKGDFLGGYARGNPHFGLYSTDISAAWHVIEELQSAGECLSLTYQCGLFPGEFDKIGWLVVFRISGKFAHAETAPLAICRAALLTAIAG